MMSRSTQQFWATVLSLTLLVSGCAPSKIYYFGEDGDLSHYVGVAAEIEEPDVEQCVLDDVRYAKKPLTLEEFENHEPWLLCLEEAMHLALANSKVVRTLDLAPDTGLTQIGVTSLTSSVRRVLDQGTAGNTTIYDPALQQSATRFGGGVGTVGIGTEAALAEFDANVSAGMFWSRTEQPSNIAGIGNAFFARDAVSEGAIFGSGDPNRFAINPRTVGAANTPGAQIIKPTAQGGNFFARMGVDYSQNNSPTRAAPSQYGVNMDIGFDQPLLQGAGTFFNRIAGPNAQPGSYNGVLIARVNEDVKIADFEIAVRNLVKDVEISYWELYVAYRVFDAAKTGRDSALQNWRQVKALRDVGAKGGEAEKEAQSRSEYFRFRGDMEQALTDLFRAENRLRYLLGIAATDCRLIRPTDEPTTAPVHFDWCEIHTEALARTVELRQQKWIIKQKELELMAAKNFLLPELNLVGIYQWWGAGDTLLDPNGRGVQPFVGSNAFSTLTDGNYQNWTVGLNFDMTLGFREELTAVRNAELQVVRERAILQDQELAVSHELTQAIRNLEGSYVLTHTRFNNYMAAVHEVKAVELAYEGDRLTYNEVLNAFARRAEAERAYYRALVNYNRDIAAVHYQKGSLLEYSGVYLAEGPWPAKAYHDARLQARARDAAFQMDYGITRPKVFSRGPVPQNVGTSVGLPIEGQPTVIEDVDKPNTPEKLPAADDSPLDKAVPDDSPINFQQPENPNQAQPTLNNPGGGVVEQPSVMGDRQAASGTSLRIRSAGEPQLIDRAAVETQPVSWQRTASRSSWEAAPKSFRGARTPMMDNSASRVNEAAANQPVVGDNYPAARR